MLHFENLSNLGNALQRNLKTRSAWECIFRASGGMNLKHLPTWYQLWCNLGGFGLCAVLSPKKSGDATDSNITYT